MTIQFVLDENDYLTYFLYVASKNKRVKERQKRIWIVFTATCTILAWRFYKDHDRYGAYYFGIFALLLLIFFPFSVKKAVVNVNKKMIAGNYSKRFGKMNTVTFADGYLTSVDFSGETKFKYEAIEMVTEIENYFFIRIITGSVIIISKFAIGNVAALERELEQIANDWKFNITKELDWKW